jgi:hypothetical protein
MKRVKTSNELRQEPEEEIQTVKQHPVYVAVRLDLYADHKRADATLKFLRVSELQNMAWAAVFKDFEASNTWNGLFDEADEDDEDGPEKKAKYKKMLEDVIAADCGWKEKFEELKFYCEEQRDLGADGGWERWEVQEMIPEQ